MGAPKVKLGIAAAVSMSLHPLAHHEIFPKRTAVGAKFERSEIRQYGVADAVVVEIDLLAFLDLVAQIAAVGVETEDDKHFSNGPQLVARARWSCLPDARPRGQ